MNRTGKLLLILGFLVSVFAGFGVFVVLTLSQPKPAEVQTTKLVIAFQNITPRTEITNDQVGAADWPRSLPTPVGGLSDPGDVIGKVSTIPIPPGQPIVSANLIDKSQNREAHSSAALLLDKGTVAKAMSVSVVSSVAAAIQAGDRVDIIATFTPLSTGTQQAPSIVNRLLADVLIIQVGPWPAPGAKDQGANTGTGATVITVQLKEQDALVLEYALENAGTVTLFLRPANDHDILTLDPVTLDYIIQRYNYRVVR